MATIRRIVLDILKPHEPSILDLASLLGDLPGIEGVNILIYEIDRDVENAKITIEGNNIPFERVSEVIIDNGGAIHSLDEVVAGKVMIEESATPQD